MVGCCSPVKLQPHPFGVMRKCKRMSGKCNSAAVYLAPMGGNFNQRVSGWRNREKEQAQESSCESKVTASPPSTRASRRPGSRPHRLQRIHHPVPPPEQAAQQSRTQPPCQKAALQLHILLQRRHTSPPDPRETLELLPKACSLSPACHRHVSHQRRDWTQISSDFTAFSAKTQSLQMGGRRGENGGSRRRLPSCVLSSAFACNLFGTTNQDSGHFFPLN